jgi:hypothetical protein
MATLKLSMTREEIIERLDTVLGYASCGCPQCPLCEMRDDDYVRAAVALGIALEPTP